MNDPAGYWSAVEIYPYDVLYSHTGAPQLRRCQFSDNRPRSGSVLGITQERCGADAIVIVKRTSRLTGNTYEDAACEQHLAGWQELTE